MRGDQHACGVRSWLMACLAAAGVLCDAGPVSRAATVTLIPSADSTLIGAAPNNSMGGAGYFIAGTTQNGPTNRALLKFDVAAAIPPGSTITAVSLAVDCVKQSGEAPAGANYGLHRMLRPWGEGTNVAGSQPGLGVPAATNDATWNARMFPATLWTQPGGAEGADYLAQVTSSAIVDAIGVFQFDGTFELIAEIQYWLDHPDSNFGWVLKSESEDVRFTARQFASREYADSLLAPQLVIGYAPPPAIGVALTNATEVILAVVADTSASYGIEYRNAFAATNGWNTLTNFGLVPAGAMLTARDSASGAQRFYRSRRQ